MGRNYCSFTRWYSAASTIIFPSPPATEQIFFWSVLCSGYYAYVAYQLVNCLQVLLTCVLKKCSGWAILLAFQKNSILNGSKEVALAAINCLQTFVGSNCPKVLSLSLSLSLSDSLVQLLS